ncbi:MAG TPA: HAMP domain-containing sensor histidine kinase, partial [Nitrososphaeraceae archaeon]
MNEAMDKANRTTTTEIVYGIDYVVCTLSQVISNAVTGIDICVDSTRPLLLSEIRQLRQALIETKKKGVKIRYLTEITSDNLYYCKQLLLIVDDLRHLSGIRGNFYVTETEYAAPSTYHEKRKSADMMIYSCSQEMVRHQQSIFESIWNASASAERKIKEIESNIILGTTEIIDNPSKTKKLFIDLIESAKFEILLILPTVNAFLREDRIGALKLMKEISFFGSEVAKENDNEYQKKSDEKNIHIKILTPTSDLVNKIIQQLGIEATVMGKNDVDMSSIATNSKENKLSTFMYPSSSQYKDNRSSLQIRHLESLPKYNVTTVTILIVDRKASLAIEKVDDSKAEFIEAVGLSTYSTSTPTVASYVSIFENFWSQIELYDKLRANEKMEREFINLAAHELRTPAQAILGYTELALMEAKNNDTIDSERGGYITAAYRNALRLQRLTKDILDIARIESNSLKLNKERIDIVEKIDDVINDITHARVLSPKTGYNTHIVFDKPDTSLFIFVDKVRITEVISNLITNAINATRNISSGKISVYTQLIENPRNNTKFVGGNNTKSYVIVSIKDNGIGIDHEIESRLFTKFVTNSDS